MKNQQDKNQRTNSLNKDKSIFEFEMGNELGANIEQEKTMFKNEYEKDKLKRKNQSNNNLSRNRNQIK